MVHTTIQNMFKRKKEKKSNIKPKSQTLMITNECFLKRIYLISSIFLIYI